jgi:hypothetical protein
MNIIKLYRDIMASAQKEFYPVRPDRKGLEDYTNYMNGVRKALDAAYDSLWQPIDTIPDHETEVLGIYISVDDNGTIRKSGPWTMRKNSYKGRWEPSWDKSDVLEYMDDLDLEYKSLDYQPTHGMIIHNLPLPNDLKRFED